MEECIPGNPTFHDLVLKKYIEDSNHPEGKKFFELGENIKNNGMIDSLIVGGFYRRYVGDVKTIKMRV